jgi:hypothetical protein
MHAIKDLKSVIILVEYSHCFICLQQDCEERSPAQDSRLHPLMAGIVGAIVASGRFGYSSCLPDAWPLGTLYEEAEEEMEETPCRKRKLHPQEVEDEKRKKDSAQSTSYQH